MSHGSCSFVERVCYGYSADFVSSSKPGAKCFTCRRLSRPLIKEHLLQSGLFSGVCLLSPQGESIYTYGSLQHLFKDDAQQFLRAFRTISKKAEEETVQKGFHLSLDSSLKNKVFKIYHKTYTSIYSVSTDNQMGLLVSKLPYAVMVCVYSSPVTSAKAVKQLEYFCDKMHS